MELPSQAACTLAHALLELSVSVKLCAVLESAVPPVAGHRGLPVTDVHQSPLLRSLSC